MTIRIVIADDHPIFRDGLARTLTETGRFEIVGIGGTAEEAVALVRRHCPDLVLLDLSMPGGGIDAAMQISALSAPPRIAMLTVSEEEQDVTAAMSAGAIGYILKGVSAQELNRILMRIAAGEAHISPALAVQVLNTMQSSREQAPHPVDTLSGRETAILKGVATGLSNREVAEELGIQEKTVKHYMTAILGKLHARNRVEAALIAHDAWSKN
ncbi:response regulator [Leisingera sp. D0M16]|uniref:response regulator n=1 Tax=Leisingera coralii TaxID=3351347 RepID=UPI003B80F9FC